MERRNAISGVIVPRSLTNLEIVFRDTPMALAKATVERFNGWRYSLLRIPPGWVGARLSFISRSFLSVPQW
jgi:hypothetical protein